MCPQGRPPKLPPQQIGGGPGTLCKKTFCGLMNTCVLRCLSSLPPLLCVFPLLLFCRFPFLAFSCSASFRVFLSRSFFLPVPLPPCALFCFRYLSLQVATAFCKHNVASIFPFSPRLSFRFLFPPSPSWFSCLPPPSPRMHSSRKILEVPVHEAYIKQV